MLDDRTFCFVVQHGRHAIVFFDLQGLVANQELFLLRSNKTILRHVHSYTFSWGGGGGG